MPDLKRRSMRNAQSHAMDIAEEARLRGWTAADVFGAFAQIVANQNPALARKSLDALDQVVRARVPTVASGETMPIAGRPEDVAAADKPREQLFSPYWLNRQLRPEDVAIVTTGAALAGAFGPDVQFAATAVNEKPH